MKADVIAVANHKGGVGKSFTAVSLAVGLARGGWRTLLVDCDPALQIARLQARDGSTLAEAVRILAAQASRAERLAIADDVILNDAGIDRLRDQVEVLHRDYLRLADHPAGAR